MDKFENAKKKLNALRNLTADDYKRAIQLLADNKTSKFNEDWLCLYVCDNGSAKVMTFSKEERGPIREHLVFLSSLHDNGIDEKPFDEWDEVAREDWAKQEVYKSVEMLGYAFENLLNSWKEKEE